MSSKGVVSWFNEQKGFGFITDETGQDIYVHYSEVIRDGFKTLEVGEKVIFELVDESRAPKAVSVRVINY
ncbi:cold shock protein (beta-ribbon, CspA family) [Maridesulfovibrio ferrireducens]|uniref:Cold shock protein (Beta-ribbon, CspA family) n=1 Tax=Maridesulfovibrio ferrireducens TaxID=246191 RepID=A0A1G9F9K9_9BACT|nr:cold shock domain-containing protein [Maridesulfovibrio ferrireducens]SDK85041.1 cold shock protein (beta-ribbon, CspA family) [Maridesulfovibrio ferrireducens]